MISMKPKVAIQLKNVKLVKLEAYPTEKMLPEDGPHIYLYGPGEQCGDQQRRATSLSEVNICIS